ncbi:uncharacterized protein [Notamacropus eugenii]|uniref:uncharacterized protein n=1 Tax=Notamacropus eugenii TaxID=9315 RepID=UPI003B66BA2F
MPKLPAAEGELVPRCPQVSLGPHPGVASAFCLLFPRPRGPAAPFAPAPDTKRRRDTTGRRHCPLGGEGGGRRKGGPRVGAPGKSQSLRARHSPHRRSSRPAGQGRAPRTPATRFPKEAAAAASASFSSSSAFSTSLPRLRVVSGRLGSRGWAGAAAVPPRGRQAPAPADLEQESEGRCLPFPTPSTRPAGGGGAQNSSSQVTQSWALRSGPGGGAPGLVRPPVPFWPQFASWGIVSCSPAVFVSPYCREGKLSLPWTRGFRVNRSESIY